MKHLTVTCLVLTGAFLHVDLCRASDLFLPECQADASISKRACIYAGEKDEGVIRYWYYETFGTDANIKFRDDNYSELKPINELNLRALINENAVVVLQSHAIVENYNRSLRDLVGAEVDLLGEQCGYAISPSRRKIVIMIEPGLDKKSRSLCFRNLHFSIGIYLNQ